MIPVRLLKISIFFLFVICFHALGAVTSESINEERIGRATVTIDSVAVYSQMSSRSKTVKHLKKDDVVTIEFELSGDEVDWCAIKEDEEATLLGYVMCQYIERDNPSKESWTLIRSVTTKDNKKPPSQKTEETSSSKRPYSDISAILYMTTW